MDENKNLYIIAGCNGAGKTTASYNVLPNILDCKEFVNADEIAKGLSPFNVESVAVQAGRLMLERIDSLMGRGVSFSIETTLATKSYSSMVSHAKNLGYRVFLFYFWLETPELAKQRVLHRVLNGGHNIPEEVIVRRYYNGIKNLFNIFMGIVDEWMIFDNSETQSVMIAKGSHGASPTIKKIDIFNKLKKIANEQVG